MTKLLESLHKMLVGIFYIGIILSIISLCWGIGVLVSWALHFGQLPGLAVFAISSSTISYAGIKTIERLYKRI